MHKTFREKLETDLIFLDGAFGTYINTFGIKDEDFRDKPGCMEYLSITRPDLIEKLHRDYLDAGSDAVETNTFGGNAIKLAEYGLEKEAYNINLASTRIARAVCDKVSTPQEQKYVIGTMGPTGKLPSSTDPGLGNITYRELKNIFYEQAIAIIEGGADALLIETAQDLLEMKAALAGAKEAIDEKRKDIVLIAQCTLANNGRMLLGTDISAVMTTLSYLGADVIGLNCSTGPYEMEGAIKFLSENSPTRISCVPNAGLPIEKDGKTVYSLTPEEMAEAMSRFVKKYKVDIIGGCCGTTPSHIRKMKEVIKKGSKRKKLQNTFFASFYKGYNLKDLKRPLIVGERINTQGSRKTKELLINENYDEIIELAKSQQASGANILDVCTVLTERKTEEKDAVILTRKLRESVEVPLMIDSMNADVIEATSENYPGTPFINSVNLEDGGEKARRIFSLAKKHGGFVVSLTIDEEGMAKTVEKKIEVAKRLYKMATEEFGLEPHQILFDMLTFTLGTGEEEYADSALNTFEAIKRVKKLFPGVLTILGVSNVSFGLSKEARGVLNAGFLYHAVKSGLDMAIVNPAVNINYTSMPKEERGLAEALLLNKKKDALEKFINYFASKTLKVKSLIKKSTLAEQTIEEKLTSCILQRNSSKIVPLLDEALKTQRAEDLINNVLMKTMQLVGEKLDSGEMVLPYVLQSAEVMRRGLEHLGQFIPHNEEIKKGKVLLATVFGDVHDIGKNLVKMILKSNGFEVIDLGKQVPVEKIVAEAKKHEVDAVGLSALLVSTARHMKTCVQSMHDAGLEYPVLIGGAPINKNFAYEVSSLSDGTIYRGGVFYSKDAFVGLKIVQALMNPEEKEKIKSELTGSVEIKTSQGEEKKVEDKPRQKKKRKSVPNPPFYGARTVTNIPADRVLEYLNERMLFELSWAVNVKDEGEKKRLIEEEYKPLLKDLKEEALRKGWLELKAVYGYFKCRTEGDDIIIMDEDGQKVETLFLNRIQGYKSLALADYFSIGPDGYDIIAFQAVTVGSKISDAIKEFNEKGESAKAFLLHGLSVNLTEALAVYMHDKVRSELKLAKDQGKRYSPGYPLWKDLEDQKKIFSLLGVEKNIGVALTESYQMVPEQSTTAMIVYDSSAEY